MRPRRLRAVAASVALALTPTASGLLIGTGVGQLLVQHPARPAVGWPLLGAGLVLLLALVAGWCREARRRRRELRAHLAHAREVVAATRELLEAARDDLDRGAG